MTLGSIEVLVISFPGNQFNGGVIPELERLVDNDTISIIDGLLVTEDANGQVTFTEFEELGGHADAELLAGSSNPVACPRTTFEFAARSPTNCSPNSTNSMTDT